MEHIKSYSDFINENLSEEINEGWKTWVASILAGLSLATSTPSFSSNVNTPDGGNKVQVPSESNVYKGTVSVTNPDMGMAQKLAKSAARREVLNKVGSSSAVLSTKEMNVKMTRNTKTGEYTATVEYTMAVADANTKQIEETKPSTNTNTHTFKSDVAKQKLTNILNKWEQENSNVRYVLLGGQGSLNTAAIESILHRFIDNKIKNGSTEIVISTMEKGEAENISNPSVKFTVEGSPVWFIIQ